MKCCQENAVIDDDKKESLQWDKCEDQMKWLFKNKSEFPSSSSETAQNRINTREATPKKKKAT